MMAGDIVTVPFDDETRIWRPTLIPNALFTPLLPSVLCLKILVAPECDDDGTKPEKETVPLQASMELDGDTPLFVKIVLMFSEVAAVHLDLTKSYIEQGTPSLVAYVTEIAKRFPKFEDYYVDGWPAYSFASIYLEQLQSRHESRQEQERRAEMVKSVVHSVYNLLDFDPARSIDE